MPLKISSRMIELIHFLGYRLERSRCVKQYRFLSNPLISSVHAKHYNYYINRELHVRNKHCTLRNYCNRLPASPRDPYDRKSKRNQYDSTDDNIHYRHSILPSKLCLICATRYFLFTAFFEQTHNSGHDNRKNQNAQYVNKRILQYCDTGDVSAFGKITRPNRLTSIAIT